MKVKKVGKLVKIRSLGHLVVDLVMVDAFSFSYPKEFNGIKLSFLQDDISTEDWNPNERIPSWFWLGPTYENLPLNKNYRKRLCSSLLDFNHKELCSIETFHIPN